MIELCFISLYLNYFSELEFLESTYNKTFNLMDFFPCGVEQMQN